MIAGTAPIAYSMCAPSAAVFPACFPDEQEEWQYYGGAWWIPLHPAPQR